MFTIRVGDYILYPAFFVLLFLILIIMAGIIFAINMMKERREEHSTDDNYRITKWQRQHAVRLCKDYINDNGLGDEYGSVFDRLERYVLDSTYWNLDEMLDIDKDMVKKISIVMFLAAQESYILGNNDDAVLLLNTLDMINGGPDNPDYTGGDYPWIGEDVPEMRNHQDMSEEEARTLHLFFSAVGDLISFVDEDLGKIPEASSAPDFCKRITQQEMEACAEDLVSIVDIRAIKSESRDIVCKAMFLDVSIMIGGIFMSDNEDSKDIRYIDEYRRYSIRALAAAIDNQTYSEVIDSIDV